MARYDKYILHYNPFLQGNEHELNIDAYRKQSL